MAIYTCMIDIYLAARGFITWGRNPYLHMHTWNVPSSGFAWFPVHIGTWFEWMRRHEDNVPGRDSCDTDSAIFARLVIDAALLSICTKTPIYDLDQFHGWIWSKSTIQNTIHGWIPSSMGPMYREKCVFKNQKTMRCIPFTTCHIGHSIHYEMIFH